MSLRFARFFIFDRDFTKNQDYVLLSNFGNQTGRGDHNKVDHMTNLLSLIEMLVVLLIISVLLLLFVPNLTKQKDSVKETGNAAVVKVVESQAELYELNHTNDQATLSKLIADGNITNKQAESYRAYYAKNSGETRAVAD